MARPIKDAIGSRLSNGRKYTNEVWYPISTILDKFLELIVPESSEKTHSCFTIPASERVQSRLSGHLMLAMIPIKICIKCFR